MDVAVDHMSDAAPAQQVSRTAAGSSRPVFLVAALNGRNEVPVAGGPAVGDRNGRAVQVIRIRGNQVFFAVAFKGVAPPTASHIHEGVAGVNRAIKVNVFSTALPGGVSAATGSVTVDDPRALDFGRPLTVGDGKQEVPVEGGPAADDRAGRAHPCDGRSVGSVWAKGGRIDYSLRWSRIVPPTLGHLHQGNAGVNGPVVGDLFKAEQAYRPPSPAWPAPSRSTAR
jgi:hypothetical protein